MKKAHQTEITKIPNVPRSTIIKISRKHERDLPLVYRITSNDNPKETKYLQRSEINECLLTLYFQIGQVCIELLLPGKLRVIHSLSGDGCFGTDSGAGIKDNMDLKSIV